MMPDGRRVSTMISTMKVADITGAKTFNQAQQDAAQHGPVDIANAAQHSR
jgi:hypothetical protein